MKKNKKFILSLSAFLLATTGVLAWMITEASRGTQAGYDGRLYIVDSDVEVSLYVLKNNSYQLQSNISTDPLINIDLLEPGRNQKYRFDITNNNSVTAIIKINFANLTGDVDLLDNYLIFTSTNPEVFSFRLSDRIMYDEDNEYYYFNFIDEIRIPANETVQVFWSVGADKDAGNEIEDAELAIDRVVFTKPS